MESIDDLQGETILFPGRFQPFHEGHEAIVRSLLAGGAQVVIGIRDTALGPENPLTLDNRIRTVHAIFRDDNAVVVMALPDFAGIAHGRDPGWTLLEVKLSEELQEINGTDLRAEE